MKLFIKLGVMQQGLNERRIKLTIREFILPLVRDVVILGSDAPIGPVAMNKALNYLHTYTFSQFDNDDEIIHTVFIRESLLNKVSSEKIISFLLQRVRPLMTAREILQIDMEVETIIEGSL